MKRTKQECVKTLALAAASALLLLLAAGCASNAGSAVTDAPASPVVSEAMVSAAPETPDEAEKPAQTAPISEEPAEAAPTEEAPTEEAPAAEPLEPPPLPLGVISQDTARLNVFLTSIVQQDIVDTRTDLDEDAELVRFVFGYRKTNDPKSVLELEDGGVSCRTLTLEQVNETLMKLFGKSISPDLEDYSILLNESEGFHCYYRDGRFWNAPPYPTERYSFPIRFALVNKIDEETHTLHFRLYQVNPWIWGVEEAERHIGVLPFMNFVEAEGSAEISNLGEGDAVLRDFGEDLLLIEMVAEIVH